VKRVVNGKAYNTETAERIALAEQRYDKGERTWISETTLYRTPKGAWFLVETEWPQDKGRDKNETRTTFTAFESTKTLSSLDQAFEWVKSFQCELLNPEYFPTIEEA
jgi:hypothetical protein